MKLRARSFLLASSAVLAWMVAGTATAGICNKLSLTAAGAGATASASSAASALGISAVAHSSGVAILTGSGGYIAGTLGTIGAGALAVASSPVVIIGGATVAATTGGMALYCYLKK